MKKLLFLILITTLYNHPAHADEYTDLITYRNQLKEQIEAVDSEIARCKKTMKGWEAATIIGSIGAVASGIGIIAQNQKIKENKKEIKNISQEYKDANEITNFIQEVKK